MKVLDSVKIADDLIRSYWHPIGHKSELACDRDFIRFEIKDFEVVVINDKGNFVAFDNLCPHRGARFFTEDFGNQFVKCLYHGWSYSRGKVNVAGVKNFQGCGIETGRHLMKTTVFAGAFQANRGQLHRPNLPAPLSKKLLHFRASCAQWNK